MPFLLVLLRELTINESNDSTERTKTGPRSELVTLKEVYFASVRLSQKSMSQFKFYEDDKVQSGIDRYMLLDNHKENAIFHVSGKLTYLSITPAGAVQHRRQNAKVDEYTVRLRIEKEEDLKEIDSGIKTVVDLLKSTPNACQNIAVSAGLVEKRLSFNLSECIVKMSNYSNDVFYFNRKVAKKEEAPKDDGETPDFLLSFPKQGVDYPSLHYPTGWHLQPLIPITDAQALPVRPEDITPPRQATVYFELRQGCYNFEGYEGPVKQIVLIPNIIAIKVAPPSEFDSDMSRAKRRRLSC